MLFVQVLTQVVTWLGISTPPVTVLNATQHDRESTVINNELSQYIERVMETYGAQGLALAVVKPDGEVEYGAWGNKTEDGEKVTPETLFNIASCSKAFLSASMGILIDDFAHGRNTSALPSNVSHFDWNTKLKDILPNEWKLQDPWASEKASIQDVLSHLSGLPRHDGSYGQTDTLRSALQKLRYLRPTFELRERWQYNNMMYMTGAHILSTYTGSCRDFVKERIFSPIGMNYSTYSPTEAALDGLRSQCWTAQGKRIRFPITEESSEMDAGPGGVITNVIDLSKWLKTLIGEGVNPATNTAVIPKSAFDATTTARAIVVGKGTTPEQSLQGYGMGWGRSSYQGHEVVSHSGGINGFSSLVSFFPNERLGVAILLNADSMALVAQSVTNRIAENVLNLTHIELALPRKPQPKPPRRPDNAKPPLPLESYTGTYGDQGYGSVTLCDQSSTSFYCDEVLRDFRTVDNARSHAQQLAPSYQVPQLFAAWDRLVDTHIRLVHWSGNTFNFSLTSLYPAGYGKNTTPFESTPEGQYVGVAEFLVENGTVLGFGTIDAAQPRPGGTVYERAEVFMRKV